MPTVVQLKEELRAYGLETQGRKAVLEARLAEYLQQQEKEAAAEEGREVAQEEEVVEEEVCTVSHMVHNPAASNAQLADRLSRRNCDKFAGGGRGGGRTGRRGARMEGRGGAAGEWWSLGHTLAVLVAPALRSAPRRAGRSGPLSPRPGRLSGGFKP